MAERLPPDACKARITCELPREAENCSKIVVKCRVENLGPCEFVSRGPFPVLMACKWYRTNDSRAFIDRIRADLPDPLAPGQSVECSVTIPTLEHPGKYRLVVTLVQEWCTWFDDVDSANAVSAEVWIRDDGIADDIAELTSDVTQWPVGVIPDVPAGIVISGCGRLFQQLYGNLRNIREIGCDLPIDIWHLPGEFTDEQARFLADFANLVNAGETAFSGLSGRHEVHGFKAWMLAHSRFRKTLMLDVNSFPLRSLNVVFESDHACILWRDGPWEVYLNRIINIRRSLDIVIHPCEFESGQLYVDRTKSKVREAMRLASALNTLGAKLYKHTHGDKETYALAFDLLNEPFVIAPEPTVHPPDSRFAGLLQPWLDGSPLFYHPLIDQHNWWKFKREWTALHHQAMEAETLCR